ncbi:hypothetical protein ACQ858_08570 [Variovorax ureilyticus]|uniref:hypothetical protein n=1 Tax=Variovorax ureilyticus TaxID=1836198 RepID=UPI003D679013
MQNKKAVLSGFVAVLLVFIAALVVRSDDFRGERGAENLEASYHTLLTITALHEVPVARSHLLPIVNFGGPKDINIPWGATVRTPNGDFVYTSFPPLAFLVPAALFQALNVEPSLGTLASFNAGLGLISAFLLFAILVRILTFDGHTKGVAVFASVAGASLLLLSKEGLHSFGPVYWAQQLAQLFLLGQLAVLVELKHREPPKPVALLALLGVISFLAAYTEWTGFVANGLIGLAFVVRDRAGSRRVGLVMLAANALAIGAITVHLASAIGWQETLSALSKRFFARSAMADRGLLELLGQYWESFGLLLVLSALAGAVVMAHARRHSKPAVTFAVFALLVSLAPLVENFIMLQHAWQFSYDRLKLVVPLSVLVASAFAILLSAKRTAAWAFALILLALSFWQNSSQYLANRAEYAGWAQVTKDNERLLAEIKKSGTWDCAVVGANGSVRGYASLLFHRGVYEAVSSSRLQELAIELNRCAAIFLEQERFSFDLPRYTSATIYRSGQEPVRLTPP